jgi:hypothetical protein
MRVYKRKYSDELVEEVKKNIRQNRKWNAEEIELLKNEYHKHNNKQKVMILLHKKGYTDRALKPIILKALKLGLTKKSTPRKIEYTFICENCDNETYSYIKHKRKYCNDCHLILASKKYKKTIRGNIARILQSRRYNTKYKKKLKEIKQEHYKKHKGEYARKNKIYREKNKENILEKNKIYYQNNKEKLKKYQKTEKFKKYAKKYREENKEKIEKHKKTEKFKEYAKIYAKKYYQKNKEKILKKAMIRS